MRKYGLVLVLFAAAAVFGAAPEKSDKAAAPAKSAEAAPAKDAKAAPAAAVKAEPVCAIPWMIPAGALELKNDLQIDVPAEGIRSRVDMKVGEKLLFKLVDVSSGDPGKWEVCAVDKAIAKVEQVGKDEGGWFSKATVSFEISACKAGRTLLEMGLKDRRGAPIRMFRCYIEVK